MKFWHQLFWRSNAFIKQSIKYNSNVSSKALIILDGWGEGEPTWHNAIYAAQTPNWDKILLQYPKTVLHASGLHVGLPAGQPGNSEAGHIHIGAGTVILQDFSKINAAIADGSFASNPAFVSLINDLRISGKKLHIFGLLTPGGTHSHQEHLFAFLELCYKKQFNNIYLHLVIDGRDPKQNEAGTSLAKLRKILSSRLINGRPVAQIASMIGRQYALNRSQDWDKTAETYNLLTAKEHPRLHKDSSASLQDWYKTGFGGMSFPPTRFIDDSHIKDNDCLFIFNYRADRVIQIVRALISEEFSHFARINHPRIKQTLGMMPYANDLATTSAFTSDSPKVTLGKLVAQYGMRQLRIAEEEKSAHVGALFNGDGGSDTTYNLEERVIFKSPATASYENTPEMKAVEITEQLIRAIQQQKYGLIVANFANIDILGHTGNLQATMQGVKWVDECLGRILACLQATNTEAIITADHGNGDKMYDEFLQKKHTAHTSALVPCIYVGPNNRRFKPGVGSLTDIAPSMLELLDIPKPKVMSGKSLFDSRYTLFRGEEKIAADVEPCGPTYKA